MITHPQKIYTASKNIIIYPFYLLETIEKLRLGLLEKRKSFELVMLSNINESMLGFIYSIYLFVSKLVDIFSKLTQKYKLIN